MSNIENLRGIECSDSSEQKVFVRAPIEFIQKAFEELFEGDFFCDTYDKNINSLSFLIYQFRGHSWTTIHNFWPSSRALDLQDKLLDLSRLIQSRVISYTNINTTYEVSYSIHDAGQHVETFHHSPDTGLSLDPDSRRSLILKQDPFQWVDDFFEEQGIFVPLFSIPLAIIPGSGGIYRGGTVKFIKPVLYYADGSCSTEDPDHNPEYLRTDFERVDAFTLSD